MIYFRRVTDMLDQFVWSMQIKKIEKIKNCFDTFHTFRIIQIPCLHSVG